MKSFREKLEKQIQLPYYKKDAEDCIKIYDKLLELRKGVWARDWYVLVRTIAVGKYPNSQIIYKPSEIGVVFLNGVEHLKK